MVSSTACGNMGFHRDSIGIIAHRGFWNCEEAGYARNSIAALRCAQDKHFWGSEFDVNMTSDSVLIVYHDSYIDDKRIEEYPYEEFKYVRLVNGEPIPTIDMYLEQARKHPQTMLVYELKPHSSTVVEDLFVELTINKLKEYKMLKPSKVMFISFSYHICQRMAQLLPKFTVQYLGGDKEPEELVQDGISGLDYNYGVLLSRSELVSQAAQLGLSVNTWTVNDIEDMKRVVELKVSQVTSDFPLELRSLLMAGKTRELR